MDLNKLFALDLDNDISSRNANRLLISIIILAAILRLWGIWHGYPYSYYPDEEHLVKRALSFGSGDLNPHWFHKPAFYMYILFFEYGLFFLFGKLAGFWQSVNDFAAIYITNPGPFYIIGRLTTTMFSVGSVFITYLTGKHLLNRKIGLFSALILAITFGHVMVAKDVKTDTPCMFFTLLSVYFLVKYINSMKINHLFLSSLFAGVGTATKYYTFVMLVPIFFSILLIYKRRDEKFKYMISALKTFSICIFILYLFYFACSPYNFIDPLGRQANLTTNIGGIISKAFLSITQSGNLEATDKSPAMNEQSQKTPYKKKVVIDSIHSFLFQLYLGMGWVMIVLVFLGIMMALFHLNQKIFIFSLFPMFFVLICIVLTPGYAEIRHQIVLYPFLVIFGGLFCMKYMNIFPNFKYRVYILLLILMLPLSKTIAYNIDISKEDTRNLAKIWIEQNIPAGSKIVAEDNDIKINPDKEYLMGMITKSRTFENSQFTTHSEKYYALVLKNLPKINYSIAFIRFPWWREKENTEGFSYALSDYDIDMANPLKPIGTMTYDDYKKKGYEYVVTNSENYIEFRDGSEKSNSFPSFYKFYKQVFKNGKLLKEFNPKYGNMSGPIVRIYKII